MHQILVFDIWGDLAHFKKPYTTTSPLSFAFPPRPTIAGMISAIIGLDKTNYAIHFSKQEAKIGLRIINPIKKIRISQNLIDTKRAKWFARIGKHHRARIRFEYIKQPKYRIYFFHKNRDIYDGLKQLLADHGSVYTISLGLSSLLANYEYVGEFEADSVSGKGYNLIHSVVPSDDAKIETFEQGKEYYSARIPLEMDTNRIVTQFGTVLLERRGLPLRLITDNCIKVSNGENILWL